MDIPPDRTAVAGQVSALNPMGTDGFEVVEFTGPDIAQLEATFASLGFAPVARHRSKTVTLWRQGDINFILNAEPDSFAQAFQKVHGPSACAMAFRVADAAQAVGLRLDGADFADIGDNAGKHLAPLVSLKCVATDYLGIGQPQNRGSG